jgi:polar amino acid transport system permease protein
VFRWDIFGQFLLSPSSATFFLKGAWTTVWISVVSQAAGVIIGLLLALMRMSSLPSRKFPALSGLARVYVWFFRGSPLLVQILLLFDGLPRLFPNLPLLPDWACVVVAFSLNEGAYMSEIVRAGIDSVDVGQMEASKALGMRYWLAMRRIILPQAARVILPPLGNEFNNMLKTTSLASIIGIYDLTYTAETFGAPTFTLFELLIVATLYYLVLTTLWGFVQSWLEKRLDPNRNIKVEWDQKNLGSRIFGFGFNRAGTGAR